MENIEETEIVEEVEKPEVPTEEQPVEEPPAGSRMPMSNTEALAYREKVVKDLEANIPVVIDALVEFIESLIQERSEKADPVIKVHEELLSRAYSASNYYSDVEKANIIKEACAKYAEQGYDVRDYKSEIPQSQIIPTYTITLTKEIEKMFEY